jgi:hypothetical protein
MWCCPVINYAQDQKRIYDNYEINDNTGEIRNNKTKQIIKTFVSKGYYRATLFRDKRGEKVVICRALLSTFVGKPPSRTHTADHINRHPLDDRLDNLRWATKKEQSTNQQRTSKKDLKNIEIISIDDNGDITEHVSISEAVKTLGASQGSIHNWLRGKFKISVVV